MRLMILVAVVLASVSLRGQLPPVSPPVRPIAPPPTSHILYLPGDLPLIFSAGHGGSVQPSTIPSRTRARCSESVLTAPDRNTWQMVVEIREAFYKKTGKRPHVVVNRLHRNRMDTNRTMRVGACNNPIANQAWTDFHTTIERAAATFPGLGWFTDVHGHGHHIQRLELGYGVTGPELRRTDASLDTSTRYKTKASVHLLADMPFSQVIRGPQALGTLFTDAGYAAVPSRQTPAPKTGESYFHGSYTIERHGCEHRGQVCGHQMEMGTAVRATTATRERFADVLVDVYRAFFKAHGATL